MIKRIYIRESFIFSKKVGKNNLGYDPSQDFIVEFYKNPTVSEMRILTNDPEDRYKVARGFISNNDNGDLFAWNYDLLHVYGIDYLSLENYLPYHDGDLHRVSTRFGVAVTIHKEDIYVGDTVKIKGFEHIIQDYFDKCKLKNPDYNFIMRHKSYRIPGSN